MPPGGKSKIDTNAIAYFNLSEKDIRAAMSSPSKSSTTMDQLKRALGWMPSETILEKRDRAVFSLLMLTGIRDCAATFLLLGHVDIDRQMIVQEPKTVRTKNSKLIEPFFCRLGLRFKAFSQNLGHESVVTTLSNYGQIPLARQRELVRNAGRGKDLDAKLELLLEKLNRTDL